jgi:hypothetical protein
VNREALETRIAEFLCAQHVVTLATTGDGAVHAASVMYAPDRFDLYWMSDPRTRHSQHLERNQAIAATVAPDYADFREIRGLQIAGTAARVGLTHEVAHARALMLERYAFLRELAGGPDELRQAFEAGAYYRLRPETITLIDNSLGFGHKETLAVL